MSLVLSASTPLLRTTEADITFTNDMIDLLASLVGDTNPALVSVQLVTFEQSTQPQFSWAVTLEATTWEDASTMILAWALTGPITNGFSAVSVAVGTETAELGTWYRLGVVALTNTGRRVMGDYTYIFCDQ